jgi:hypothetical protein
MKVSLKTNFSNPLRLKEELPEKPEDRPKAVPLACINIKAVKEREVII